MGFTPSTNVLERLKKGSTADIMFRIEERLEVFRKSGCAGCGEWPAMKRVLESGDVELSNDLSE